MTGQTTRATKGRPRRQRLRRAILFFLVITFPITMNYFSPVIIMSATSQGVVNFSLLYWSGFAVLSVLLGRAMCGWTCPLGAFQEVKDRLVPETLKRYGWLRPLKYVLTVGWIGTLVALAAVGGGYTRIDLLYFTDSGVSIDSAQGWIAYAIIVGLVLVPNFAMGRRGFCAYFCPWGAQHGRNMAQVKTPAVVAPPGGRFLTVHELQHMRKELPNDPAGARHVADSDMYNRECIYCGTCVDTCPQAAIRYVWGRPPGRYRDRRLLQGMER